jgi:hypothetical protein
LWPLTEWRKALMIVAKMISSVKRRVNYVRRFRDEAQDSETRWACK